MEHGIAYFSLDFIANIFQNGAPQTIEQIAPARPSVPDGRSPAVRER